MSVNSSYFDDPFLFFFTHCLYPGTSTYIAFALCIMYILILPLPILVLYLGYQKSRKQHSSSTATSHTDHFTFHAIIMQFNEFLGFAFLFIGSYINNQVMLCVGIGFLLFNSIGQGLFHILTCVERYLAIVHPVAYLGLRQAGGVRNTSIGCVWLLSFGYLTVFYRASYGFNINFFYCISVFFLIVVSFCSISALYVLKRPGPGEVGGNRKRVDQSKKRAFQTIMAITGVLFLRFGGNLIFSVVYNSSVVADICLSFMSIIWFELPSSLVLPLLFLHRAGKLQCCKQNTESR